MMTTLPILHHHVAAIKSFFRFARLDYLSHCLHLEDCSLHKLMTDTLLTVVRVVLKR